MILNMILDSSIFCGLLVQLNAGLLLDREFFLSILLPFIIF